MALHPRGLAPINIVVNVPDGIIVRGWDIDNTNQPAAGNLARILLNLNYNGHKSITKKMLHHDPGFKPFAQKAKVLVYYRDTVKNLWLIHDILIYFLSKKKLVNLSLYTNTDNLPCDGCKSNPGPANAIEIHSPVDSVILQQAMCNTCFHIFCTCCSP